MSKGRKPCRRACKYRGEICRGGGCDYLLMTGKSRLKAVYDLLGVDRLSAEQLQKEPLLRPENCPLYEKRKRGQAKKKQRPIALPGSRIRATKQPRKAHNKGVFCFDVVVALRLYQQGLNDNQIAAEVGATRSNVYWWRKVNGLPSKWEPARMPGDMIRQLFAEGKTNEEIASAIGKSTKAVKNWRMKHGLKYCRKGDRQ